MSTTNFPFSSHLSHTHRSTLPDNSCGSSSTKSVTLSSTVPHGFDLADFTIRKLIAESEFKVYLIQSKLTKEDYALKVYPFEDGRPSQSFLTEIQYTDVSHCNLIKIKAVCSSYSLNSEEGPVKISYIVQEYAPYGDFFNLIESIDGVLDEKLIRTYFHQLIAAMEFLHENNLAHLDIKLENLLLDKNFQLQMIDFDLSKPADATINEVWGSPMYRAPELMNGLSDNLKGADIYSAGIVLFAMKSGGVFPFVENHPCKCQYSYCGGSEEEEKLENFWEYHTSEDSNQSFERAFRELFLAMVNLDPSKRPTIKEIKSSVWYNKEIYTRSELIVEMNELLGTY